MIILILYQKLESSIVQFYNFLNHFNDSENSYLILQEIIKNAEYTANELQYELPLTIKINNININNNNFKLTQNYKSKKELLINQGNKILITGESGSGKTTFINAYLGYIDGITFEGNKQPLNLYSNYIIMYQTIRSDIPTSKINIKELFSIETSKEFEIALCKKVCKICCIDNWLESNINLIDDYIDEKISGGEKSRLIMATKLYSLIKNNKKALILDEPEQGSDKKNAYRIITNLLNEFKDITVIIISHLENIENYKWDTILNIQKNSKTNIINIL